MGVAGPALPARPPASAAGAAMPDAWPGDSSTACGVLACERVSAAAACAICTNYTITVTWSKLNIYIFKQHALTVS
jgi:hypothetical protein